MVRRVILGLLLIVLASVGHSAPIETPPAEAKVTFIKDVASFLRANPQLKASPMNRGLERGQVRYTAGNRINGDRLVAYNSDNLAWGSNQDVELSIAYPASGIGAIVTAIDILVNQSSSLGQAYILSGGIGQRSIVVVVEAYNTWAFSYESNIYGV